MKERPILFSGAMVRAILDGRKTQTRRVVKAPQWVAAEGRDLDWSSARPEIIDDQPLLFVSQVRKPAPIALACPYGQPGDQLWVRETFAVWGQFRNGPGYCYRADGDQSGVSWRSSIHMPRAASRITLEVTGVRCERVQDISEADAIDEGMQSPGIPAATTNRAAFAQLWDSINAPRGYSWADNPWVWVLEFKRIAE